MRGFRQWGLTKKGLNPPPILHVRHVSLYVSNEEMLTLDHSAIPDFFIRKLCAFILTTTILDDIPRTTMSLLYLPNLVRRCFYRPCYEHE